MAVLLQETRPLTARIRRLITSGWWVAVAAVVVSVAIVLLAIVGSDRQAAVSRHEPGFDLDDSLVPRDQIIDSGMPRDGLAVIDAPTMIDVDEVERRGREGRGKFLVSGDRVVGIEIAGDARAYPLRFLRWHEVVNDTVGGAPIVVSYNGLSDSVVVTDRRVGDEVLDFGVSGLLFNSNLLLYDRRDVARRSSLWSQLQARAIAGPAAGNRLRLLPASLSSWGDWREAHPATRVLAPLERLKSVYKRDPYHSYFGSDLLRFPVAPLPPGGDLRLKDRVVVLDVDQHQAVFALPRLAAAAGGESATWTANVGGAPVTIEFDATLGTAAARAPDGVELGVRHAFWFAWYATHPSTGDPLPVPPPPTR
jgi:hypothetical protein